MKHWLKDFPTHQATVVVALIGILSLTGVTVVRLALGQVFPDGYDTFIWSLVALSGVTGAWGVGKRLSDYDYAKIQAGAPPDVKVEAPESTVNVSHSVGAAK